MKYWFKTLLPSMPSCFRGKKSSTQRLIYLVIVLLGTSANAASDPTMREILGGYIKDRSPVFYSECGAKFGKAMLIFDVELKSLWFYEFEDGRFHNSSEVTIEGSRFTIEGFGGIYSRERTHIITAALLKTPFTFLMPEQLDLLLTSKPRTKCPELDPNKLYRSPPSKK